MPNTRTGMRFDAANQAIRCQPRNAAPVTPISCAAGPARTCQNSMPTENSDSTTIDDQQ